ncbi:hypothetical protein B0H14DRAFT_2978110 [Mycena olivaceomarginata]|nr:hypothetical protein B0H14DRAFT_2978110 [Mycena olivaceomarginata]
MREGYTSYFRQPRIAPKSADLARLKTAHPGIKLWLRSDYKKPTSTQRQRLKKAAGATNRVNDVNTTGRYIEDWDGEVIGGKELGFIREESRNLFEDVLAAGKATRRYKNIGHQIRCAMVYVLELKFPYLALCADHWKAALAISDIYRHWAKHIKSGLVGEDGRPDAGDVDDDDDDEDEEDDGEEGQNGDGATAGAKRKNAPDKSSGSGNKRPRIDNKTCLRFASAYGAKAGNVVEKEHLNMG